MAPLPYSSSDTFQVPSRAQKIATSLRSWGHRVASLPIPFLNGTIGAALTGIAALLESGESFLKGKSVEGVKQAMSGAVDTAATFVLGGAGLGNALFWINAASWLITGDSLPEHARNGSRATLDFFDNDVKQPDPRTIYARQNMVLGVAPRTIGYVPAGVGFAPGLQRQVDPYFSTMGMNGGYMAPANYFTNAEAQRRGVAPEELRANWLRSDDNRLSHQELLAARDAAAAMGGPVRS